MGAVPLPNGLAVGALLLLGMLAGQPAAQAAEPAPADAAPATALQQPEVGPALAGLQGALPYATGPIKTLRLDPLAASKADPLSNGVALQPSGPGDHPVSTTAVTDGLSRGGGLDSLPLVGRLTQVIPG